MEVVNNIDYRGKRRKMKDDAFEMARRRKRSYNVVTEWTNESYLFVCLCTYYRRSNVILSLDKMFVFSFLFLSL